MATSLSLFFFQHLSIASNSSDVVGPQESLPTLCKFHSATACHWRKSFLHTHPDTSGSNTLPPLATSHPTFSHWTVLDSMCLCVPFHKQHWRSPPKQFWLKAHACATLGQKGALKGKGHRHLVAQKHQWTPSKVSSEEVGIYENNIRHYLSCMVNTLFAWMGIQTDCGKAREILMPSWSCDWKQATRLALWGSLAVREKPSSFPFQPLL